MTAADPEPRRDLAAHFHADHDEPVPDRVLVIVAHPDDIDFGCAGTVATMTDHGVEVIYAIVTDGDAGEPADLAASDLKAIRRAEQTEAARIVGVEELHWLGFPDGALVADLVLRKALARLIRRVRPDLVITQPPVRDLDRIYASHPDHLAVGEATVCAVYPDARNARSFPDLLDDGCAPHTVPRLWLMGGPSANLHVEISAAFERKVAALRAHHSQNDSRGEGLEAMIRDWVTSTAERVGLPGAMVEGFRSVDTA